MARIRCVVTEGEVENEKGRMVPGVIVRCGECDHVEEAFGTSERSVKRCLVLLRENCPRGEENYYVSEDD